MTPKRKKILKVAGISVVAGLLLLTAVSFMVMQTQWFSDFVRAKIIAVLEDSTGGRVEIQSFRFDPTHLTVRIQNIILHGTEPKDTSPLAQIRYLELRLKLFSGFKKAVDLAYLQADEPKVNIIVNPDGSTNVPSPKVPSAPTSTSPLATIVDLAIGQFQLNHGSLSYSQKTTPFALQGDNLHVLLNYNSLGQNYLGNIEVAPLTVAQGKNPPLAIHVNLPVTISRDAISLNNAHLSTGASDIALDASLQDLKSPKITGKIRAKVSLAEILKNSSGFLTADLDAHVDQSQNTVELRTLHVALGSTALDASGTINPATGGTIQYNGDLALAEITRLANLASPQIAGNLSVKGNVGLDSQRNYNVTGILNSQNLSLKDGDTRLSNVSLSAPFQVNPSEISLNPVRVFALGGTLSGKVLLAQMRNLNAQVDLHGFSIASLSSAFTGHAIRYGGAISGTVGATADLAQQKSDLALTASLAIAPRASEGVPVTGRLEAQYQNASGAVNLKNSSISLPNSRLDLSGSPNQDVKFTLTSQNLNDFLPAANFGAQQPTAALPVTLKGGAANLEAHIQGNLSNPHLIAHALVTNFAAKQSVFDRLSLDIAASSSGVSVKNGSLSQSTLQSTFDASLGLVHGRPLARSSLSANVTLRNAGLDALLAMVGESSLQAAGLLNADVHLNGTYGNPLGSANFQIQNGNLAGQPFDALQAQVNASQGLISLDNFTFSSAQGHLAAKGMFRHPFDDVTSGHLQLHLNSDGIQLSAIPQLQQDNVAAKGVLNLTADVAGDLGKSEFKVSSIDANFSANDLSVRNHQSGNLIAVAHTANGAVQYNVKSNFAGSNINIDGHTSLSRDYYTQASAAIHGLSIKDVLEVAGQSDIPANGLLSAKLNFVGTAQAPDAKGNVQISQANFYEEPVNSLDADFHYTNALAELSSFDIKSPAGAISLTGRYTHPIGAKKDSLQLTVRNADLQMAKIKHVQTAEPGLAGTLHLAGEMAATVDPTQPSSSLLISSLNADVAGNNLLLSGRSLGTLKLSAHTANAKLNYQLESDIAQSQFHASGESQLSAGYPSHITLTFSNVRYANIARLLSTENDPAQPFDALVEGKASLNGQLQDLNSLQGHAEITHFDMQAKPRSSLSDARTAPALQNDGPLVVSLNKSVLKVEKFRMRGPKTSLDISGSANFSSASASDKLQINLKANTDLSILQDTNRNFYSSGNVAVDAVIGGALNQPVMNGKIELHGANLNYADAPNGISNGEGVILLNGKTATIQNLTGESGGGKITVGGFVGLSPRAVIYNLQATAARVRTRYSGVSLISDANLRLTGSSLRSLLSGKVVLQKVGYSSSSDIGSLLSSASVPPATSSTSTPLLSTIRLDINVSTASDIRVVSSYVEKIDLNSNLQVRGTAAEPGIVGHINVANGQLAFFGNSYTINQGSINFYDATAIKPELNLSLETIAQGVDVVLGVTGPVSNMKLSYRSDPPLSFEQIVQLLATNTTPFDPTIAAHQPTPAQQSMSQMGESAVLGQAIANPVASRVQRVFGLSQFKIDPSVAGNNGQPTAKVTLQQKIANNITFTYITDVTQSNSQIIRVQLDLSPKVSAVALRDYNGNVSVEMFYKFQVR